jgi:hypothetical protein
MKRIPEVDRTIYLERHLAWSLIVLCSSVACLLIVEIPEFRSSSDSKWILLAFGMLLGGYAIFLLGKKRVFIIDKPERILQVIEGNLFRKPTRLVVPLQKLRVRLVRSTVRHFGSSGLDYARGIPQTLWIDVDGEKPLLFIKGELGPFGPEAARQLAMDMNRPFIIMEEDF